MFSLKEKQHIAREVEKLLLSLNHPEMPKLKPRFHLHVKGAEDWSWADIHPNWTFEDGQPARTTSWNENARDVMKEGK